MAGAGRQVQRISRIIDEVAEKAPKPLSKPAEIGPEALDLRKPPEVQPVPPDGTNVEFIVIEQGPAPEVTDPRLQRAGRLSMRVYERGVGETRACGTGACAAALAASHWAGSAAPREWLVTQPGGTVLVEVEDDYAVLSGPAVLTAEASLL